MFIICDKCNLVFREIDARPGLPVPCGCRESNPRVLNELEDKIYRQGIHDGWKYFMTRHVEKPKVAYLCKFHQGPYECKHTTHIEDALNFEKLESGMYMEKIPETMVRRVSNNDSHENLTT